MIYTLEELSLMLSATLYGERDRRVTGAATLRSATSCDICFVQDARYVRDLETSKAAAVIITEELLSECPTNALVVENPRLVFAEALRLLYPDKGPAPGVHPAAVIGQHCDIAATASIAANVVIGDHVTIGANTLLYPNVVVYDGVTIGCNSIIHAGAVIGADGFGFEANERREWVKIPQIGSVVIGNSVEIGANSAIDRGALEDTIIGNGVKIDDQVMVAHNVQIGDHTLIAGCTGIAGSARIGRHCIIGGYCAINGHITLADGVVLTGFSMATHSLLQAGVYSSGTGILPQREWRKCAVRFRQLDKIYRQVTELLNINGKA